MPVNPLTFRSILCVLLTGLAGPAAAQVLPAGAAVQSLPAVRRAAEAALRREIGNGAAGVSLDTAEIDARLRLAACDAPLAAHATLPRGTQARVLVRVSCKSNVNWSLNVPVNVQHTADVLVMRRAIARGEHISAGDVSVQSRILPGLASPYVSRVADLGGRLTRRSIPEGAAVTADALDRALLIERGQSVILLASGSGLEIRAPGLALADAALNERVRVQNLNSLKIVEGVAEKAGVVRVTL